MPSAHDPGEFIAIVDDADTVIGTAPRKNHAGGRLHREASVLILNSKGEILVQERDDGHVDYSASGHFRPYEDYLDGAVRETSEELGLEIDRSQYIKIFKHRIDYAGKHVNRRFTTLFEVRGDYEIKEMRIDPAEVKSVKYYTISELKALIKNSPEKVSEGFKELLKLYFQMNGL